MTKLDEWIRSFPENCEKIKERAKQGCKESKKFLDDMKKVEIEKFDLSFWAEMAHMQVAILAMKDFSEAIKDLEEACNSGESDVAEVALSKILNANPKDVNAFSDIVEENTGKPSVVSSMIPLISGDDPKQLMENEKMRRVHSRVEDTLEEYSSQTDIAALRKDAQMVTDTFCRARRLAEAVDSGCEEDILSAAEEFVKADDNEAINHLNEVIDKDELSDEEMEVIREMYKNADLDHLDLDPMNALIESREEENHIQKATKQEERVRRGIQIHTYADWHSSWHR